MISTVVFTSNAGERLAFQIYHVAADWNAVAGIYMFCRVNAQGRWQSLYVGQASSFKDRLCAHEQWAPAVKLGATHVHAIVVPTQSERDRIKRLLIAHFDPLLNVQHRPPSLGAFGVLGVLGSAR